jgi:hypothetical protein
MTNYLYFNGIELGRSVYCGYNSPCSKTVNGITMNVGANDAQVGVNVTDVTDYLNPRDNVVTQGDDGDCMMPSNAFLVISYQTPTPISFDTGSPENPYPSIFGWRLHDAKQCLFGDKLSNANAYIFRYGLARKSLSKHLRHTQWHNHSKSEYYGK